jgi:hypothetical protein
MACMYSTCFNPIPTNFSQRNFLIKQVGTSKTFNKNKVKNLRITVYKHHCQTFYSRETGAYEEKTKHLILTE